MGAVKLPKFFQVERDGKKIGALMIRVKGKRINLRTKDHEVARARRLEAMRGKTKFRDDAEGAAAATIAALDNVPDELSSPKREGEMPHVSDGGHPSEPATGAPEVPPSQQQAHDGAGAAGTGPVSDAGGFADLGAAAGAAAGAAPPVADDEDALQIDPAFLEGVIDQLAAAAVEGQYRLQEWLIARGVKLKAGTIPADSRNRTVPTKLWGKALRRWIKIDVALPDYAQALIMVGTMGVIEQVQTATPLPPPDEEPPIADADIVSNAA
jgi:hypothetical protein